VAWAIHVPDDHLHSPTPSQQYRMEQEIDETSEDAHFGCHIDDQMELPDDCIDYALNGACEKASESEHAVPTSELAESMEGIQNTSFGASEDEHGQPPSEYAESVQVIPVAPLRQHQMMSVRT
jgi:hypothetical protein